MKNACLLFLLMPFGKLLFAQADATLVNFSAQQVEDYVRLSFTVRSGITCLGTQVEHSETGMHFETIGIIPGICGSNVGEETYFFNDTMPSPNRINYYRVNFGNYGVSHSISVSFFDFGNSVVVAPNPVADKATIYFPLSQGEEVQILLFDAVGGLVDSFSGANGIAVLERNQLPPGIYLLRVEYPDRRVYASKILLY
jgi:hypothetical protein